MRRYIITSIFMASICSQIAQGKQSKPVPNLRRQSAAAIKVYSAHGKREYGNTIDDNVRTLTQLVYDGTFPEQGFVITTKEKKPQQEQ